MKKYVFAFSGLIFASGSFALPNEGVISVINNTKYTVCVDSNTHVKPTLLTPGAKEAIAVNLNEDSLHGFVPSGASCLTDPIATLAPHESCTNADLAGKMAKVIGNNENNLELNCFS